MEEALQPSEENSDEGGDPAVSERLFLTNLRERLLVIFEGFQSPNNHSIEAKVDLTLNFLEYLLAVTEDRLENLKK